MEKNYKKQIVGIASFEESLETFKNSSEENKKIQERVEKILDLIGSISDERVFQNLSQRDLAELTGIKQPMIARFEKAEMMPRLDTLLRITDALNLDLKIEQKLDFKLTSERYDFNQSDLTDVYVNKGGFYNYGTEVRERTSPQA